MKLEQNELLPMFSNTTIPDIFFTQYLPEANGDFLKVYLYILFLSKYDKDIKINDLCKKLGLSLKVIQDAMKYWEEQGVITKKNTGFVFNNLQELELHNLYKPKAALSAEHLPSPSVPASPLLPPRTSFFPQSGNQPYFQEPFPPRLPAQTRRRRPEPALWMQVQLQIHHMVLLKNP